MAGLAKLRCGIVTGCGWAKCILSLRLSRKAAIRTNYPLRFSMQSDQKIPDQRHDEKYPSLNVRQLSFALALRELLLDRWSGWLACPL